MPSGKDLRAPGLALFLLWLAALGCGLPGPGTPNPSTPPPTRISSGTAAATLQPLAGTAAATLPAITPPAFAALRLTPAPTPAVPEPGPTSLDGLNNVRALAGLSAAERSILSERGFVALPQPHITFAGLHHEAAQESMPVLFTADAALYALDAVVDVAWQRAERQLADHLLALTTALVTISQQQWEAAGDEAVAEAAWHNLAFFSVAARLQDPAFTVPGAVAGVSGEELTLIEQGGTFISPLRGITMDYAALQPPERYASDPALAGYHQARRWLSQPVTLSPDEPEGTRQQARQLALMVRALEESENGPRWQRLADTLAYFENGSGANSLEAITPALGAVAPETSTSVDDSWLDDLAATLLSLPADPLLEPSSSAVFTFLPPPSSPAQTILPALVYNRVGRYQGELPYPLTALETNIGSVRALPRSLDVAAAYGSEAARSWLAAGSDSLYEGYEDQLALLQATLPALPPTRYGLAWLQATAPLLAPRTGDALTATIYDERALNSWLGGWLLLHHETELAPRPVEWTSTGTASAPGFVDAQPQLLAALAAVALQVEEGLRERDLLDAEVGQKLLQLERLYRALEEIARADMSGEPLDDDEQLLLRQLAPRLETLLTFASPAGGVPLMDVALARHVTLYTDPSSGIKLVGGIGPAWTLHAVVERGGEQWLAAGGILTPYELRQAAGANEVPAPESLPPAPWLQALLAP